MLKENITLFADMFYRTFARYQYRYFTWQNRWKENVLFATGRKVK